MQVTALTLQCHQQQTCVDLNPTSTNINQHDSGSHTTSLSPIPDQEQEHDQHGLSQPAKRQAKDALSFGWVQHTGLAKDKLNYQNQAD
ncbi:hypothetical protein BCR42DRAFT_442730 [Absidia repens]|uniref:Uncharacterized protein n=1 Tax=Absidia repens TaxID=90262 RepID=A0A1X2I1H8_9FUNG|nr:hypothetical protein BCR42DRAFT_442730 [Absidia repens]